MDCGTIGSGEIATWVGSIATFIAVVVALFKEELVRLWRRPVLNARIKLAAPDCHKTQMTIFDPKTNSVLDQAECYYFRLWVSNIGNHRAEKIQVFVSKLLRRHADGSFVEDNSFLPMNLRWSHSQLSSNGPEIFADGISPQMGKHCDFGHIIDPSKRVMFGHDLPAVTAGKTILAMDLEMAPATLSHLIPPGVYRFELKLASSNSEPITKIIEITLTGNWFQDESKMFSDGVGMKEIK
jgi:hypothetical protein